AFLERHWGVHFPIGGTGALVAGLIGLIESLGGTIRLGEEIAEIVVEHGRATGVRLASGHVDLADVVVSNADAAWTYRHLVPATARRKWTDRRIERAHYSMGLFVWYFGTKRTYEDVAHHTIVLGPRYRELLADIFDRKLLADDFSLYLHRPTATDPSLAPEGCDTFYVLSPVPNLDGDVDWSQEARRYQERICRYLSDTVLPDLHTQLAASHYLSPLEFREQLLAFRGAAFSFEPILRQSAYFRPHNRSEDVERLYFVGAGTHPGAGVPGVLSSARVLDTVVPSPDELD
ncbi:MAG: phytoene desaturase family protein, partial [Gemmatimonadota bacterium]|nr:phytoene desaturase family protein [Gemmatimonadota bacterium]